MSYDRTLAPMRTYLDWAERTGTIWWTRKRGAAAVERAREARLADMLAFARAHSPFYRRAWHSAGRGDLPFHELPPVTREALMASFDDWVTDPEVKRADVEAFIADRAHLGQRFRDRYLVWKSSGTTGIPGLYVQDDDALATYDALLAAQMDGAGLGVGHLWTLCALGARGALIAATGEHFASIASWMRFAGGNPWFTARHFPVTASAEELTAALNDYQPSFVASYPTVLALLAQEQQAGRLHISPIALWSGGEHLARATRARIERTFACRVANEYGASECMSIAYGCREEWLHVNADWVLLEPVDRDYRPVPAGEPSNTVLLTNLANRVQPIIRYDLGDSVVANAQPCVCGNPLPAIRLEGRCDDVIDLVSATGRHVKLPPLAISTVVEEAADVHRFQVVQTGPDRLRLRLGLHAAEERAAAWAKASRALGAYLAAQSLDNVTVELDAAQPVIDSASGKLREVVVENDR